MVDLDLRKTIEPRLLRLGNSLLGRILVVAHTIRRRNHEEITRIISARRANRKEKAKYQAKED
jgi:uncharacterized DUF497 family protein